MTRAADLDHCRAAIVEGSFSFHAASKLLPAHLRDPALVLYAFCRMADDAVDLSEDKARAVLDLGARLESIYAGRPANQPQDRAFADLVADFDMPRALPEALLEGFAWDGLGRRYHSLSDLHAYGARVAASVGAMMCVLMDRRCPDVLARACDLGVAMQLTNIARDIGEDAQAGRLYLPLDWLAEDYIDAEGFLADPRPSPAIRRMTKRLLAEAARLYHRAEPGIMELPMGARAGIFAARNCYAAIGGQIEKAGFDSITRRATTTSAQKMRLCAFSAAQVAMRMALPRSAVLHAKPLEETAFLVEAAGRVQAARGAWGENVISVLAQLEAQDRSHKGLDLAR